MHFILTVDRESDRQGLEHGRDEFRAGIARRDYFCDGVDCGLIGDIFFKSYNPLAGLK